MILMRALRVNVKCYTDGSLIYKGSYAPYWYIYSYNLLMLISIT